MTYGIYVYIIIVYTCMNTFVYTSESHDNQLVPVYTSGGS